MDTSSKDYLARVWLAGLPDFAKGTAQFQNDVKIIYLNVGGKQLYGTNRTFPKGFKMLGGDPTAAGQLTFTDNGDGTVTLYPVPSHYQDHRWIDKDFANKEWDRILNSPKRIKLYDGDQATIDKFASLISGASDSNTTSSSHHNTSHTSSDDETVTRDNVIDKVEEYEGHKLDTSIYTFKEPEKRSDGSWGFSILDKSGNLKGSYIISSDGHVTKYDAKGNEE